MILFNRHKFILLILPCLLLQACVEPYDFKSGEFDDLLVVQASLTDEMKYQQVQLWRTFELEEDQPTPASGAEVIVHSEDLQLQHPFWETSRGVYRSQFPFEIRPNIKYVLSISTNDGKTYISDPVQMISGNKIDSLYAERTQVEGRDGIALQVSSSNPETASSFYRYEYQETYKIVSPSRVDSILVADPADWTRWWIEPNPWIDLVCYNTRESRKIILSNTSGLSENNAKSFLVRFIDSEEAVLAHRYSILVKQLSLSPQAYSYYSTLEKLSKSESVFSENQPGFIYGNMYRVDDESERVIGFFSLSSVSSKRLYFNYEDFYTWQDSPRPMFPKDCNVYRPGRDSTDIIIPVERILSGDSRYVEMAPSAPDEEGKGPMRLIATECVDCRVYGSTEAPEFWEE